MADEKKPSLECRYYEQRFPEVDDLVVVNVRSIAEMGAYVSLLEYNNIEGMILLSELSRRRIRSINKLIRVGRNEIVVVLRCDKEKGYIDLSKRRVSPEDQARCEERYNKAKAVNSILRHVSELTKFDLEFLYQTIGWPLARRYGDAYEAFKKSISTPDEVFAGIEWPSEVVKEELTKNIKRRLTPQAIRLRADLEVTCFTYQGIEAIKEGLTEGVKCSTEDYPIKVKLDATPVYVVTTNALDKAQGIEALQRAIDAIQTKMIELGGSCIIKTEPFAINERDETSPQSFADPESDDKDDKE